MEAEKRQRVVLEREIESLTLKDPSSAFSYDFLPPGHIRLLKVVQTQPVLKCELQPFKLSAAPPYSAMSYVWGNKQPDEPIIMNRSKVLITRNLLEALVAVTESNASTCDWLWADQLCINQADLEEKAIQVRAMGNIFSSSTLTVIWLGPAANHSDRALNAIRNMPHAFDEDYGVFDVDQQRKAYLIPREDDLVWDAISDLFCRDWFHRVWVIQEAVLSAKGRILCGSTAISLLALRKWQGMLKSFRPAGDIWKKNRTQRSEPGFQTLFLMYIYPTKFHDIGHFGLFIDFLTYISGFKKATDPRDFIYAFLGLVSEDLRHQIRVDYNASPEEAFVRFSRLALLGDPTLRLLQFIPKEPPERSEPDTVPSWCLTFRNRAHPSWTDRRSYLAGLSRKGLRHPDEEFPMAALQQNENANKTLEFAPSTEQKAKSQLEQAGAESRSSYEASGMWKRCLLKLSGFLIDHVDRIELSQTCRSSNDMSVCDWIQACHNIIDSFPDDDQAHGALLAMHSDFPNYSIPFDELTPSLAHRYYSADRAIESDTERCMEELRRESLESMALQFRQGLQRGHYNAFFTTHRGLMGTGLGILAPGDAIVTLHGARPLFALRFDESGETARVVGEAFMPGYMDLDKTPREECGADRLFYLL